MQWLANGNKGKPERVSRNKWPLAATIEAVDAARRSGISAIGKAIALGENSMRYRYEGMPDQQIAEVTGYHVKRIGQICKEYREQGLDGFAKKNMAVITVHEIIVIVVGKPFQRQRTKNNLVEDAKLSPVFPDTCTVHLPIAFAITPVQ